MGPGGLGRYLFGNGYAAADIIDTGKNAVKCFFCSKLTRKMSFAGSIDAIPGKTNVLNQFRSGEYA